jgi:hypothetical protein
MACLSEYILLYLTQILMTWQNIVNYEYNDFILFSQLMKNFYEIDHK